MEGTSFRYVVKARAQMKIRSFYKKVAKKYRHTYDFDDFMHNVQLFHLFLILYLSFECWLDHIFILGGFGDAVCYQIDTPSD